MRQKPTVHLFDIPGLQTRPLIARSVRVASLPSDCATADVRFGAASSACLYGHS